MAKSKCVRIVSQATITITMLSNKTVQIASGGVKSFDNDEAEKLADAILEATVAIVKGEGGFKKEGADGTADDTR